MSQCAINILVALPIDPKGLARIQSVAPEATIGTIEPYPPGASVPVEVLRERTVLLADFPPANLAEMTSLRWLQLGSAGYEQLLDSPVCDMNVRVTNASGVNDVAIAEWSLLMMLALERGLPRMIALQQKRIWERSPRFQSELRGRRVGIIGYGNIGRETARLCRAHGMDVWAMNRAPIRPRHDRYTLAGVGDPDAVAPTRRFRLDQMAEFLPHLDYLILTMALNAGSQSLLGAGDLRLLPAPAFILNPARAHLIDELDLLSVLREGRIAGAAFDSHYREPMPPDDPFWSLPNVLVTPHISGSGGSPHYLQRVWDLFATNLERFQHNQPLLNVVPAHDLAPFQTV